MQELTDRREYFRIEDTVLLEYLPATPEEVERNQFPQQLQASPSFRLLTDLQELDLEAGLLLRTLGERDRQLGTLLKLLNRKVDLVARTVIAEHELRRNQGCRMQISLSESGMSFIAPQPYTPQTFLALKLILLPSYIGLCLFGRIVYCREIQADEHTKAFKLGIQFHQVSDNDAQALARHILHQQSAARRRQRAQLGE